MSSLMTARFRPDAPEQALWQRKSPGNKSLIHHSGRGPQSLPTRHTERLAEADPSAGTAEVIKQPGPWKTMQDAEWETMNRADWDTQDRLLGSIGDMPPAEAERRYLEQIEAMDKAA
ncbi:hypothetical protein [Cribrihabitans pelagius]|uniref:hypothetical protein n=1 Tax=Cribrihabitans pelagius TaxID=1765746 RepID=UPI003B59DA0F